MAKILNHYNPEYRVNFDVDETLVRFQYDGNMVTHQGHLRAIKEMWRRGFHITVHSAGGSAWARVIVDKLGIGEYVHEISAKPRWMFDDKPAEVWCERIYIKEEGFNNGCSIGSYQEDNRDSETGAPIFDYSRGRGSVCYPPVTLKEE